MEVIYSGKEVKRLLSESIPGYKPKLGNNMSPSENEKINNKANKESLKNVKLDISKEESKPVKCDSQSTDLGNNKNMLDLEYANDPGKDFKDRVKKQVTGEDSELGNKPDEDDATTNAGNKAFYDAAKKASNGFVTNKQKLQNSGIVGQQIPLDKKQTSFSENNNIKIKKLNFKNTQFINEKHMLSLIPEDYKKNGSKFIMKDKANDEYLIEWFIDDKNNISEGKIINHENKAKINEEFNRMKSLYQYRSKDHVGKLNNSMKTKEDFDVISENIRKLKEISNN